MVAELPLGRIVLRILIGALCVAAAVASYALLGGEFSDTDWKVIGTSTLFALTSSMAAAGLGVRERARRSATPPRPRRAPPSSWSASGCGQRSTARCSGASRASWPSSRWSRRTWPSSGRACARRTRRASPASPAWRSAWPWSAARWGSLRSPASRAATRRSTSRSSASSSSGSCCARQWRRSCAG